MTLAASKSSGKIPSSKDNLKICNKGLLNDPKQLLKKLQLFSSSPGLLFVCREKNAFVFRLYSKDIQVVKCQ